MENYPKVKKVTVVLNGTKVISNYEKDRYVVNCNTLDGEAVGGVIIGSGLYASINNLNGKIVDITYKDCIADETVYADENGDLFYHSVTHKEVVDISKTNDINLMIACVKAGIKDMYNDFKEMNHD